MKPIPFSCLALLVAGHLGAVAQPFNSGSDGSFGPLEVSSDRTIELPPDGVIHATTITVDAARTLRFLRNAANTPVTLLATGDVIINGIIDVGGGRGNSAAGGLGGPGGFDGGMPATAGTEPGDGYGPGAGGAGANRATTADGAGSGAFGASPSYGASTRHGKTYGSALLMPVVGGSGGGGTEGTPGFGGGGGGGAILIVSSTRIVLSGSGRIHAMGGIGIGNAINSGSGGGVRLLAPVVAGNGTILVGGAEGNSGFGDGRIRIDTLDRSALAFTLQPTSTASIGSLMLVAPVPLPRIELVEVAGNPVPAGSNPVFVNLPFGTPAAQVVRVRAQDFGETVPIRLVLTPETGRARSYDFEIANGASNPAETTVNVEFPANTRTSVAVWTR